MLKRASILAVLWLFGGAFPRLFAAGGVLDRPHLLTLLADEDDAPATRARAGISSAFVAVPCENVILI